MTLERGDVLDRYRVEEVIGNGGMAVVYRVTHLRLKSEHALKVLTIDSAAIKRRLLQEGQAQARLRHPNIVSVTDVIDVRGTPGLIMELVEGPTLEEQQRRSPLTLQDVDAIATGILAGVAEAHAQGLIHRDLKPSNVMLARTSSGLVPKICDFGLVKVLEEDRSLSRTKAGVTMGTPRYMSPEQIRDAKNVDERADVFSLGALLYEMVTQTQAFPGEDPIALFKAIDSGSFVPPRELVADLPVRMEDAIVGALANDREDRIASVASLMATWTGQQPAASAGVDATAAAVGRRASVAGDAATEPVRVGQDTPPTLLRDPPPSPSAGRGRWAAGAAAVGLLVMVGLWQRGPREAVPPVPVPPTADRAGSGPRARKAPAQSDAASDILALSGSTPEPTVPEPKPVSAVHAPAPPQPAAAPRATPARSADTVPSTKASVEPASRETTAKVPSRPVAAVTGDQPGGTGSSDEPTAAPDAEASSATSTGDAKMAVVRHTGARKLWLERGGEQFAAGAVPAGTYTVTAYFEGVDPVSVGEFEFKAGEERVLACSSRLRSCR